MNDMNDEKFVMKDAMAEEREREREWTISYILKTSALYVSFIILLFFFFPCDRS